MKTLIVARHGEAASNIDGVVSGVPPGAGLSAVGRGQAIALRAQLVARDRIELGVCSRFARARETLELAFRATVPTIAMPDFDEIGFGSFEGGPLAAYREWAWTAEPSAPCPGGGESRTDVAVRLVDGLELLLGRWEQTVLLVSHALPLRYVLDAADGSFPAARIEHLEHATPYLLSREQVVAAMETLRAWAESPQFRDAAPRV